MSLGKVIFRGQEKTAEEGGALEGSSADGQGVQATHSQFGNLPSPKRDLASIHPSSVAYPVTMVESHKGQQNSGNTFQALPGPSISTLNSLLLSQFRGQSSILTT